MHSLEKLRIKIFADGADLDGMLEMYSNPLIKGFTTNPTLMRRAGVENYEVFAKQVLASIPDRPISFEVFSDEFEVMERQAEVIASWGKNVNVKIPVTNSKGVFAGPTIKRLSRLGIPLNITAIMSVSQVRAVVDCLEGGVKSIISVFAGRIADTGVDPLATMEQSLRIMEPLVESELIWASPRELLNVFQAEQIGCHIITATNDILKKLSIVGKNLDAYSLETVRMFYEDALKPGYSISLKEGV